MLNPRKPDNELIEEVSKKTDSDALLVERITKFYWKSVKNTLIDGNAHNVMVNNYGTFVARPRKVQSLLDKYTKQLEKIQPTTFQKQQIIHEYKLLIDKLNKIKELIEEDKLKKEQLKAKNHGS